ncbi:MAG: hypothetical protein HGA45_06755 [Chloroflexales bacterium]|nr:hypothetical protein [Chloroflexales bacterium]
MASDDVIMVDRAQLAALHEQIKALRAQLDGLSIALGEVLAAAPPAAALGTAPLPPPAEPAPLVEPGHVWSAEVIPAIIRGAADSRGQPQPVNGVDFHTGRYLVCLNAEGGAELAQARPDPRDLNHLHKQKLRSQESHLGVVEGINEDDLAQSRWAAVVNAEESTELLKHLTPLIQHRAEQQGIRLNPEHLQFRDGERCGDWYGRIARDAREHGRRWLELPPVLIYRVGDDGPETASRWLSRHGVAMGPVDPRRGVPFYLMLAGRPGPLVDGDTAYIPFDFQYQLDQFWGVGRVCFTGDAGGHVLPDYTRYAERVIDCERWGDPEARLRREIVYFGTKHPGDLPTIETAEQLISPLFADWHPDQLTGAARFSFAQRLFLADGDQAAYRQHTLTPNGPATHDALGHLFGGADDGRPPAILFLGGHGAGLQQGTVAEYAARQGALLCQGWQGDGDPSQTHWFTADDLGADPKVAGMVAVLFACFGAGSPSEDQFVFGEGQERPKIAPFPLVARLPQRLLLHGSLAVLGHVDRAWSYSFQGEEQLTRQSQPFENVLALIAKGKRLGFATDQFNLIQSARSSNLAQLLEDMRFGRQVPAFEVTQLWKARNDARNYALLGDPAVRLPFRAQAPQA